MQQVDATFLLPALCKEQGDKKEATLRFSIMLLGAEGNELNSISQAVIIAGYNIILTGKVDFIFQIINSFVIVCCVERESCLY